jgi:hypothetical protein
MEEEEQCYVAVSGDVASEGKWEGSWSQIRRHKKTNRRHLSIFSLNGLKVEERNIFWFSDISFISRLPIDVSQTAAYMHISDKKLGPCQSLVLY